MSALLYYGPGAQQYATNEAHQMGRLLGSFGEEGLKADDSRSIVSLLNETPVGDRKGIVIIGPMDLANPIASDVLLKSLEEFKDDFVQPLLWAIDIGNVVPTIRSRCLAKWCYAKVNLQEDVLEDSHKLLDAYLAKDVKTIMDLLYPRSTIVRLLMTFLAGTPSTTCHV